MYVMGSKMYHYLFLKEEWLKPMIYLHGKVQVFQFFIKSRFSSSGYFLPDYDLSCCKKIDNVFRTWVMIWVARSDHRETKNYRPNEEIKEMFQVLYALSLKGWRLEQR